MPLQPPIFNRRGISLVGLTNLGQKDLNTDTRQDVKQSFQTGQAPIPDQATAPPIQNRIGGIEGQP